MLRTHTCVICGDPLPTGSRLDRRYCKMSCRSVAYRAKKHREEPVSSSAEGESRLKHSASSHGCIPKEVLDVLAKHFGVRDAAGATELAVTQRRIVELQKALEKATSVHERPEAPALAAAQAQVLKLTERLEQERTVAAEKVDTITTQTETLRRQQLRSATTIKEQEEELVGLKQQLLSAQTQLVDVNRQLGEDRKRIEALTRAAESHEKSSSQAGLQTEAQEKQLQQLKSKLAEAEQLATTLSRRLAEEEMAAVQQQQSQKAELAQLQAELDVYRQEARRDEEDPAYSAVAEQSIAMLRTLLLQNQAHDKESVDGYMRRFGLLLKWSVRWFLRHLVRALLASGKVLALDTWAAAATLELREHSRMHAAQLPYGLTDWAEANISLLGQLALMVAGVTGARLHTGVPLLLKPAVVPTQAPAGTPPVPGRRVATVQAPSIVKVPALPQSVPPHVTTPSLPSRPHQAEVAPHSAPASPPPQARVERPARAAQPNSAPQVESKLGWQEQLKQDRLAAIMLDLISISGQLAQEQDTQGLAVTARRPKPGVSIGEQAVEEAMSERWSFVRNPPAQRSVPVAWAKYGVALDEQSEHTLRDLAMGQLVDLEARLRILKRRR